MSKKKDKLTKTEETVLQMACDVVNSPFYPKSLKDSKLYQESLDEADAIMSFLVEESSDLREMMVHVTAMEMARSFIKKAFPMALGMEVSRVFPMLDRFVEGDAWMDTRNDRRFWKMCEFLQSIEE